MRAFFVLLRASWRYAEGRRWSVVVFITLSIGANVLLLVEPYIIGRLLTTIQTIRDIPHPPATLTALFLALLGIQFIFWCLHGPARVLENTVAFHVRARFVDHLYRILTTLSIRWHRDHHSGQTINRLRKATNALYDFQSNVYQNIEMLVRFVGSIGALVLLFPLAAALVLSVTAAALVVVFLFDRILMRQYEDINEQEHYTSTALHDYFTNVFTVISLRLEELTRHELWRRLTHYFPLYRRNVALNETKWFLTTIIIACMTVAVLAWYAAQTLAGGHVILVGTVYMLYDYLQKIGSVFYTFAWKYSATVHQYADFRSVESILRADVASTAPRVSLPKNWRTIHIDDLHFTYEGEGGKESRLHDVAITLRRGRTIALVGESGSGKSTIMALLRGLYVPSRVTVMCDGKLLRHGLKHLAHSVTLIPQDPEIFANTVEYNVTVDTKQAKREVLEDIACARFTTVLQRLPKGLRTNVAEKGVSLSGGEKQRLALARGFFAARDTDIILLDEPTSSVDAANEHAIYRNLFRRFADRCIVSSLHKLHLLPMFDEAYVIAGGRVVEHGPVQKLLKGSGVLARLWTQYHKSHGEKKRRAPSPRGRGPG